MKTIIKSALICAALSAGLVSCSKEDSNVTNLGENKSVRIKLSQSSLTDTRAVGTHVGAETVNMTSAYVYFTNSTNDIVSYVEIDFTAGGTNDTDASDGKVGATTATTTGFEVLNLPGTVASGKVFVVGNLPAGVNYPTSGNMSQLDSATKISVESQYDSTNKGVAKVTLLGSNILTQDPAPGNENQYTSVVNVYPISARVEVGKVTGEGRIKSFTLKGIYINNYFPAMGLNGLAAATIKFNGSVNANYSATGYPTDGILSDYTAGSLVAQTPSTVQFAPVATATTNDVWGYNVLAPDSTFAGVNVPHIILHVTDVVTTDGTTDDAITYQGDKYLTIRNLYLPSAPTIRLTSLNRGTVYRIAELKFDESHLTANPELASINVMVTAQLMTWVPEEVTYDFD